MPLTLLIGGVRAGKSTIAATLAEMSGIPVVFIATAEARDDEMSDRIARHRAARPREWITIEEPLDLAEAFARAGPDAAVVLDCLTLWVSNLLLDDRDEKEIEEQAEEVAGRASQRSGPTFVVTNEVGSGVHPSSELGRRFRDVLGRVNTIWAKHATDALLVVAGRTLALEPIRGR